MATANIKEDFTVPKVTTKVATSVIQTGSSCGGYHKGYIKKSNIGGAVKLIQSHKQFIKERTASIYSSYKANNCYN